MSGSESHDVDSEPWVPPWDGTAYAANTAHHRAHDADFLASTPIGRASRVLDLGCGSGDLTATLAGLVPDGHVVGVDAQPSMLAEARRRARPNQFFVASSVQRLDEALPHPDHDGAYDVVVSRAVLQWVPLADWPGVLASAARLVRPGGWVRIECGGAGNIARVVAVMDEVSTAHGGPTAPWTFTDAGIALDLLEVAGLDPVTPPGFVRTVGQRRPFDGGSMLGWLRSQAFQAYESGLPTDAHAAFRAAVEARLDDLRRPDGTLDQTYVRLDMLAQRPG
jgi:ubiquinone/menaquinone biosynthesis C-methylase UbiE